MAVGEDTEQAWRDAEGQPVEEFVRAYGGQRVGIQLQNGEIYVDQIENVRIEGNPLERHREMMQGMLDDMRALGILDER